MNISKLYSKSQILNHKLQLINTLKNSQGQTMLDSQLRNFSNNQQSSRSQEQDMTSQLDQQLNQQPVSPGFMYHKLVEETMMSQLLRQTLRRDAILHNVESKLKSMSQQDLDMQSYINNKSKQLQNLTPLMLGGIYKTNILEKLLGKKKSEKEEKKEVEAKDNNEQQAAKKDKDEDDTDFDDWQGVSRQGQKSDSDDEGGEHRKHNDNDDDDDGPDGGVMMPIPDMPTAV